MFLGHCQGWTRCVILGHCWTRHVFRSLLDMACFHVTVGHGLFSCHCWTEPVFMSLLDTACFHVTVGHGLFSCHCWTWPVFMSLLDMACFILQAIFSPAEKGSRKLILNDQSSPTGIKTKTSNRGFCFTEYG